MPGFAVISSTPLPHAFHIVQGDTAAALVRPLIEPPDTLLADHDQLSHGPLRPFQSLDRWRKMRAAYHDTVLPGAYPTPFQDGPSPDLLVNLERLRDAETITVWLGTGLADQLRLAWMTALLPHLEVEPGRLRIVQFDYERGWETVHIGVLNPVQIAAHPPPIPLNSSRLDELSEAWSAASAETPDALISFVTGAPHPLTHLRRGFRAFLYFFPDLRTGLNAWELELLRNTAVEGPKASMVIGYTLAHDREFPNWVGTDYLLDRIRRLSDQNLPHPLLAVVGDGVDMATTRITLTDRGRDILAGRGNAVEWNGINDWVGGVHLNSADGRVWFHDTNTLIRA
jgi:hypothetical protein